MGIQGLLQFIKDASEPVHVKKYRGQTVAVDTYCWLHKGAFSCAEKLAKGEPTDQYVSYCMKFVDMLLSFGVKPILVFDGRNLPSKQEVEKARRERREANLQKGKQLLRQGKLSEARDCFTRCVNVTPTMAHEVIKAARTRGVDCVVAPYEADAQLAFLNKSGIAHAVITEDSDLLAFGCKKVLLKMDKQGNGLEIDQCHLGRCRSLGDIFTEEKFRYMCILSGCDYLASLYGIGLGKACKLLRMANNPDILKVIRKIGQYLKMNITVPEEYVEGFVKANNTFLYQLVFDPINRKVVPLNPYPENIDLSTLSYAGVNVGDKQGLQMALGNVDIYTMKRIDNFDPDAPPAQPIKAPRSRGWNDKCEVQSPARGSIWNRGYLPSSSQPQIPSSPDRPSPTRGKERLVTVKGLKLSSREPQVKRPREESETSEVDILEQYSISPKRQCRSEPARQAPITVEVDCSTSKDTNSSMVSSKPRPRNRFATLLQWRNQSDGNDGEQGTRSRFFGSVNDSGAESQEQKSSVKEESSSSKKTDDMPLPAKDLVLKNETVDPLTEPSSFSPSPSPPPGHASMGLSAFKWSSSTGGHSSSVSAAASSATTDCRRTPSTPSGLSALRQFQRKKDTLSWGESSQRSQSSSPVEGAADIESPPGSPPSQDSAYFSQPSSNPSSVEDYSPTTSHQVIGDSPEKETDHWKGCDTSAIPSNSPVEEVKCTPMRSKVSGLPRTRPSEQDKGVKIKPSAPARVSGLRKKTGTLGKKGAVTNENNPGLQATISGLWKNFGFKKESSMLSPSKKGKPMSPVKDNV
ncbi:exonuclease 1 [Astyanax mexicanus]|uniref:Exonuclease 1 n=1 Tax=Astyanax mexicanus TaxID=7994 RepID=W5KUF1_ASTMX|nr:exonuclease 1 [Astyanax mexicanus]